MLGNLSVVTATLIDATARFFDASDRRLREVEADPRIATTDDIELLVRAHAVPETQVWAVVDRMILAGLDATLVWSWTMQYDAHELADLCGSTLSDAQVVAHLEQTAPAAVSLRVA